MNQELMGFLFKTNAIRVCPKDKPFWYTSGKIGPYYVNTHFLYGSEEKANSFLSAIDRLKDDKKGCSKEFHRLTRENYGTDPLYKGTIDALLDYIKNNIDVDEIEYVSGGERRDWFFSFLIADFLDKPHITLFKDNTAVIYKNGEGTEAKSLDGAKVLHVADLITTASSYERAWVPAINKLNGIMKWSVVVVDRLQGGADVLKSLGVESHALVSIDSEVFKRACQNGYIDEGQLKLVLDYLENPEGSMKDFLMNNPAFLENALNEGGKAAERAKLLIENNFYDVKSFFGSHGV
ncbi:MAG: orotate phosphoribosyltransferase [Clostridiaceae bacterium]|nr:orotate phosphoribosyltransferase [Clostridiaceae bacterium]